MPDISLPFILKNEVERIHVKGRRKDLERRELIRDLKQAGFILYNGHRFNLTVKQFAHDKNLSQLFLVCPACGRPCRKLKEPKHVCHRCQGPYKRFKKTRFERIEFYLNRARNFPQKAHVYLEKAKLLFYKEKRRIHAQ